MIPMTHLRFVQNGGIIKRLSCRAFQQRLWTSLSRDDILEIRESLRPHGSNDSLVTLLLASEVENDSLSTLGSSTAVITLSNHASRNALTGKMMAELADAIDALEHNNETLSSVIVRGDRNFFCAGADIRVAKKHLSTREGGRAMSTVMIDTLTRLRQLPLVTVAAIEGMAIGGGAELTTAMDYRIMHSEATMRFVHAHMGVSPGWGGGTRLVKLVGRQHALELLGAAHPCSAEECLRLGLVDKIVGYDSNMDDTLVQFLDRFVHADPSVLHAAKKVVAGADDASSFEESVANEQRVFLTMWGGEANRAALNRAKNKSEPRKE